MAIACKPFTVSIRRYVQVSSTQIIYNGLATEIVAKMHSMPELQEKGSSLGMDVLDYDGCTVFHVRDWDNFVKLMPVCV